MRAEDIKKRVRNIFHAVSYGGDRDGKAAADGRDVPDAVLVFNRNGLDKNYLYLTGLCGGVFENCGVVAEKGGRLTLMTTALEEELARDAAGYDDIIVYRDEEERREALRGILTSYSSVGIAFDRIPHSFYRELESLAERVRWEDVSQAFRTTRMLKSPGEIEKIERACEIADKAADLIPSVLKRGMTETELGAEIDHIVKRLGSGGPSFETIVAFGENTSKPHYRGGAVPLMPKDPVLVDFGAEYEGYTSDITRVFLTGKPAEDLVELYRLVNEAKDLAFSLIAEGKSARAAENEVKAKIDSFDRYEGRFIHSLGHSIGLDVHDDSYPFKSYGGMFRENMVLTVEPGVYLPGLYGIRLEDDIVVKKDGCELLTNPVKEPKTYEI